VLDVRRFRGLRPATPQVLKLDQDSGDRCLVEAVLSNSSPLIGKNVRSGRFRTRYNAVIIAIARNGRRLRRKIGDVVLHPGDTLLLEAHRSFVDGQRNSRDFLLVSSIDDSQPVRHRRAPVAILVAVAMVSSVLFGALSLLEAALVAAGLMIVTRCTTGGIARRAVDWQVLLVIAMSFAIGVALQKSGAADALAHVLIELSAGSPRATLALVFVATALFTALATNNAAAVIMFPIAHDAAAQVGANFMPFVIVIMVAASASFATPIGYQTNLMVYGAGGYRFGDYIRAGVPLTLLVGVLALGIVPVVWPL
jgi:di/tricarboxylate transporter